MLFVGKRTLATAPPLFAIHAMRRVREDEPHPRFTSIPAWQPYQHLVACILPSLFVPRVEVPHPLARHSERHVRMVVLVGDEVLDHFQQLVW